MRLLILHQIKKPLAIFFVFLAFFTAYISFTRTYSVFATFNNTPVDGVIPPNDGAVFAIISDNNGGYYLGGTFTSFDTETDTEPRNLVAHILPDGTLDMDFAPNVDGEYVNSLVLSPDGSTLYLGGSFTEVNGITRNNLAAVETDDGALTAFNPNLNGSNSALEISPDGSTIYAGGSFSEVNTEVSRNYIVAFDPLTGEATNFDPNVDGPISDLELTNDGDSLYVAGDFNTINGTENRNGLAGIDTSTGEVLAFDVSFDDNPEKILLSNDETSIYVSGPFTTAGGEPRNSFAQFDLDSGNVTGFDPDTNGAARSMILSADGNVLYATGNFSEVNGSDSRNYIAGFNTSDGSKTDFNPSLNDYGASLMLSADELLLYVGGAFTQVNDEAYQGFVAFEEGDTPPPTETPTPDPPCTNRWNDGDFGFGDLFDYQTGGNPAPTEPLQDVVYRSPNYAVLLEPAIDDSSWIGQRHFVDPDVGSTLKFHAYIEGDDDDGGDYLELQIYTANESELIDVVNVWDAGTTNEWIEISWDPIEARGVGGDLPIRLVMINDNDDNPTRVYIDDITFRNNDNGCDSTPTPTDDPEPENQPPEVNAGPDQTITFPETAILDGEITDDGLPDPPGTVSVQWSVISGPGEVDFVTADILNPEVSFSEPGEYILELFADDGEHTAADEVTITVEEEDEPPVNQPPEVNAGPDQTITFPETAILDGEITDDGLPDPPGMVSAHWSLISGPGDVDFVTVDILNPEVSFSEPGEYILELFADDGEHTAADEVTITVEEPAPVNQPPEVNAGTDQIITFPETAILDGEITDDGLPDPPGMVTAHWSLISGPGEVEFETIDILNPEVSFSEPGEYVLELFADDGELTAADEVTITVEEPLPTPTNTPEPTATNTPVPTATNTPVPTATNTPVPTATNTPVPTATNTPVPTATNTPTPTNTPVPTTTNTPTPTNAPLPTATNTPVPTVTKSQSSTLTESVQKRAPNCPENFKYCSQIGPNDNKKKNDFISGSGDSENVKIYIPKAATPHDLYIEFKLVNLENLYSDPLNLVPFPWSQGLNTASDIYKITPLSAFNGYPVVEYDAPGIVILPFDPVILAKYKIPATSLRIAVFNPATRRWEVIPNNTVINWKDHTIANTTMKYGYFAVVYRSFSYFALPAN